MAERIFVPQAGRSFSPQEFLSFVRRRVTKVKFSGRIAVAVSGGKDSAVLAEILSKTHEIFLIHFDPGISPEPRKKIEELADILGVEVVIVNSKEEFGFTVPEAVKKLQRGACSVCSLLRRYVINKVAWEKGADFLATGHTMDDMAALGLMNLCGNPDYLPNIRPVLPSNHPRMVPRVRPLFWVRDEWSRRYAELQNLPFTEEECPLAEGARSILFKSVWNALEKAQPGAMERFLKNLIKLVPPVQRPTNSCRICGFPTSKEVCAVCRIKQVMGCGVRSAGERP